MLKNDNLKTFFLFPQKLVFEDIAEKIISSQTEAFVLNNHVEFKEALKIFNENSLAFINIDSVLSENEWIEYVRNIREDSHFSNIKIGILSFNSNQNLIDIYKNELKIECGYHILSSRNRLYETDILEVISRFNPPEKNKILRLDFDRNDPVNFKIKAGSQSISGNIDALSSAAMSVTLANDKILSKGFELNSIQISYRENHCKLMGTVIGNSRYNKNNFIIKFNNLFDGFHREPLFKIIHQVLDYQMKELVK